MIAWPTTTAPEDSSNGPNYHVVAQIRYDKDGKLKTSDPCGWQDDPKPLPKVPPIPSREFDLLVDKIVTTPSTDHRCVLQ